MAKQRIVQCKLWDDSYIVGLTPTEKLLFLYLLTNPLTNISGVYELPLRRAAFDTGVSADVIEEAFRKFEADGKTVVSEGWIGIVNFIRHQTLNPKVKQGIVSELKKAPRAVVDRLSIDYRSLGVEYEDLSHLNLNSNTKINRVSESELSPEFSTDFRKQRRDLIAKMRL